VATAQQLSSLARELRQRGHQVTVVTSARGYDDPSLKFASRETWNGVQIIRIPTLALGKESKWRRALNFLSFLVACSWRLLLLPRFDCVVALTSPPLISVLGALFVRLKGGDFYFWVMDLNPDEAVAAGWLRDGSMTARILERMLRYSLKHSTRVVALDRFMKRRIELKGVPSERIEVISPWPFDDVVHFDLKGREAFRLENNLADKFVVMHAGNHSPCHPLDTLLEAARALATETKFAFCFVGGGSEQAKVTSFAAANKLTNVQCLPYQPIETLGGVLSAADLQVAVMGEPFVGIVHPCKVYNILAVGTPMLYVGPGESSIVDVARKMNGRLKFYVAQHGDVDRVVDHIRAASKATRIARAEPGNGDSQFSKSVLLARFISLLEANESRREAAILGGSLNHTVGEQAPGIHQKPGTNSAS
jgi:glycosyltransferase involved in cell wall biosynthesis